MYNSINEKGAYTKPARKLEFTKLLILILCIPSIIIIYLEISAWLYIDYMYESSQNKNTEAEVKPEPSFKPQTDVRPLDLKCYTLPQENEDVLFLPGYKVLPNSVFFLETSCRHDSNITVTPRQACAWESAAHAHQFSEILVLFLSPVSLEYLPLWVTQLLRYPNIQFLRIDADKYFVDTPLADFDLLQRLAGSDSPVAHASDVLRLLTLWKYGGTCLDSDFLMLKSINTMENFAGAESDSLIANGVLNFNISGSGKQVLEELLLEARDNFLVGNASNHNGSDVLTRVLRKICNESDILKMTSEKCNGFAVFPPPPKSPLYQVPSGDNWELLIEKNVSQAVIDKLIESSFGVHMWNEKTKETFVDVGSGTLSDVLASQYCPEVYSVLKQIKSQSE